MSYAKVAKKGLENARKDKPIQFSEKKDVHYDGYLTMVISNCFGGFTLSDDAKYAIAQRKKLKYVNEKDLYRNDPDLIAVVKELGEARCTGNVYGLRIPIKMVTFRIDKNKEAVSIFHKDGLEFIYIQDENKKLYQVDTDTGKRILCGNQ